MNPSILHGHIQRFPGKGGWYYVPLSDDLCTALQLEVRATWPALKKVDCKLGNTIWTASIMPIKDGPLFVALPASVRKAESLDVGDPVEIELDLSISSTEA